MSIRSIKAQVRGGWGVVGGKIIPRIRLTSAKDLVEVEAELGNFNFNNLTENLNNLTENSLSPPKQTTTIFCETKQNSGNCPNNPYSRQK